MHSAPTMTEDKIEAFALGRLQAMRYGYKHGPTIAHHTHLPTHLQLEQCGELSKEDTDI